MAAPSLSQIKVSHMLVVDPTSCGAMVVFSSDNEVQGWLGGFTVAVALRFPTTLLTSCVCGGCRCMSLLWMASLCARIKLLRCCALRAGSFCGATGSLMAAPQWFRDLFPTLAVVVHLLPD